MAEVMDKVLAGLAFSDLTMHRQITIMDQLMDKSNNTLLHIESNHKASSSSMAPSQKIFNLQLDQELGLVNILENFQQLIKQTEPVSVASGGATGGSALEGCVAYRQRVEHLRGSVRRLKVLCDTVQQMKFIVEDQLNPQPGQDSDKENKSEDEGEISI